jgi:hypothetical protein
LTSTRVGDGAIGFKGTESVTNLMNTLQGAAANSAAANGASAPAAAAAPAAAQPATPATEATVAQDQQGAAVTQMLEGMGKNVVAAKRDTADDLVDDYEDLDLDDEVEDEYKRDVEELEGEVYRLEILAVETLADSL